MKASHIPKTLLLKGTKILVYDAMKDIKVRMKMAKPYKDVWPSEFIVIEYLQSQLREKKKYIKELKLSQKL